MTDHRSSCDEFVAGFVIERYVAGKLSESETAAFEEHLLECDRCQEELTLAVAVREALKEGEAGEQPSLVRRLPWRGVTIGLTLAAAVIATILILPIDRVSGPIAELGRVTQPPVYLGVPVRQAPARPDSVFDAAMSAYSLGQFGAAAAGLEEALELGADSASTQFFLGASFMMLNRPEEAAESFDSVVRQGDSPYLTEARFYLAKALLQQGSVEGAIEQLDTAASGDGGVAALARALADSVAAVLEP